eukprot:scaffold19370_cov56-Phaeocystis_antarctica.AAC.4
MSRGPCQEAVPSATLGTGTGAQAIERPLFGTQAARARLSALERSQEQSGWASGAVDGRMSCCKRGGHFGPTLAAQLRHACVDPGVARAPLAPRAEQGRVTLPWDLLADGVALHTVEVRRAVAAHVVELAPEQLAVQRDGRLRVLARLGVDLRKSGAAGGGQVQCIRGARASVCPSASASPSACVSASARCTVHGARCTVHGARCVSSGVPGRVPSRRGGGGVRVRARGVARGVWRGVCGEGCVARGVWRAHRRAARTLAEGIELGRRGHGLLEGGHPLRALQVRAHPLERGGLPSSAEHATVLLLRRGVRAAERAQGGHRAIGRRRRVTHGRQAHGAR